MYYKREEEGPFQIGCYRRTLTFKMGAKGQVEVSQVMQGKDILGKENQ